MRSLQSKYSRLNCFIAQGKISSICASGASYVNKAINNPMPTLKGMVRACCPLPFPKSSKFSSKEEAWD